MIRNVLIASVTVLLFATTASSVAAYPTLQEMIDNASPGAVIDVPGWWDWSGPGNVNVDFHGKAVTLQAQDPSDPPRIICGYGEHAFLFKSGEGSGTKVIGFEIYNAHVRDNNPGPDTYNDDGAGAMILNSSPVIKDCLFYDCVAENGGAIAVVGSSSPQIINCTFDHCYASQVGAAIYAFTSGTVVFSKNIVSNTVVGSAAHSSAYTGLSFNCCCFWNNTQNFSGACSIDSNTTFLSPYYCSAADSNFTIAEISSCAPAHSPCSELIGAKPVNCLGYIPGDVNDDDVVNIIDINYLIAYKYQGGPPPVVLDAGDVNADCIINLLDCLYLINYKYKDGPAPLPGCVIWGPPAPKTGLPAVDGFVTTRYDETLDKTTIQITFPVDLAALEIEAVADDNAVATSLVDNLQVYAGRSDGAYRIGLFDAEGKRFLPAGTANVVELSGRAEVTATLGADVKGELLVFSASSMGEVVLPLDFALDQNYPNPFNPTTSFSFTLPKNSEAKLEVLNVLGQVVETLVDRRVDAGQHTVIWNAANYASGAYLYRLTAGEFTETRKMVLLK